MFRVGKAVHFKFCVLIDTEEDERLPPRPKGYV